MVRSQPLRSLGCCRDRLGRTTRVIAAAVRRLVRGELAALLLDQIDAGDQRDPPPARSAARSTAPSRRSPTCSTPASSAPGRRDPAPLAHAATARSARYQRRMRDVNRQS